jgi:hypothetical protein
MAIRENQKVKYQAFVPVHLLADDSDSNVNSIPANAKSAVVTGYVNDTDDYIVLPPVASCEIGHTITIIASAGTNFELRTPASSEEEINSENCDGTKEALLTDTNIYTVTKINSTVGWMLEGRTAIGAYQTAIIPD